MIVLPSQVTNPWYKSPGDAEFVSRGAGLIRVKSEEAFSIATDSAIGRSISVTTDATTKETEHSEVGQSGFISCILTESCWK